MNDEEEFPATWEGGHALIVEFGDCEFYGQCQCAVEGPTPNPKAVFGMARPDQSLGPILEKWERHVMTLGTGR